MNALPTQPCKESQAWLEQVIENAPHLEATLLRSACLFAESQTESAITPYAKSTLSQGLQIAAILLELNCDATTIAAAIVYPAFYYGQIRKEELNKHLNKDVIKLLNGAERMEAIHGMRGNSHQHQQLDNLRKMLLAMVDDVRIVLIKLAEQLFILGSLKSAASAQQQHIAQLTHDLYAPLANRLGIGHLKWQLEDFAFRYLHPEQYKAISKALNMRRSDREAFIQEMIQQLSTLIKENHINDAEIVGRAKHIYSIHKKIQRKRVSFEEIYDASALRVLVPTVHDCYTVLSVIHATWQHIPQEFDDYIANPKPNGYQSIHTAIISPKGINVEIQIRTFQMHEESELGVAAHWKYKEGSNTQSSYEEKIAWLREVMDWQKEVTDERDDDLSKIFDDRIYVFTPQGDVYDLMAGATALDFAYHIHTSIGHRCRGAKVNGKLTQLTQPLKTGDRIEILTSKEENPSLDWLNPDLNYIKSPHARSKIRHWFKKQNFSHDLTHGEEIWDKTCKRENLNKHDIDAAVSHFNFKTPEQLLAALGSNHLNIAAVLQFLKNQASSIQEQNEAPIIKPSKSHHKKSTTSHLSISGVGNLLTQLAGCCTPIPGDDIIGYITKTKGISIHQKTCPNIKDALLHRPHRIIDVSWDNTESQKYTVELNIMATDRHGLVRDVTNDLMHQKLTLTGLTTRIDRKDNTAHINISIEIDGSIPLQKVITNLRNIPDVIKVTR